MAFTFVSRELKFTQQPYLHEQKKLQALQAAQRQTCVPVRGGGGHVRLQEAELRGAAHQVAEETGEGLGGPEGKR